MIDQPEQQRGAERSVDEESSGDLSHAGDSSRFQEMPAERVEWVDVSAGVQRLVHVWMKDGDVAWMREAWTRLAARGWTEYDGSGLGRTRVLVRLLALGHLYWDFTYAAFDLSTDIVADMHDALDDLGVAPLFIGQLAGPEVVAEDPGGIPCVAAACWELSVAIRPELDLSLRAAFEGEAHLFVSLWRSAGSASDEDAESRPEDWDILNADLSAEKMKGFEWLVDGCPVLHDRGGW